MVEENEDSVVDRMAAHLQANAAHYYPELAASDLDVRLEGGRPRVLSSVYHFVVAGGDDTRDVIVKLPGPGPAPAEAIAEATGVDRPRLKPVMDCSAKFRGEHAALLAIDRHFTALGDPRFGTIRILDYLPDEQAIIMERSSDPPLKTLMGRTNRLQRPFAGSDDATAGVANAGAWLRAYHEMPPLEGSTLRHATRTDFCDAITAFVDYLVESGHDDSALHAVGERTIAAANEILPADLPCAMGHGDYAPRNILVGAGARVTVFDTRGSCRPPIYEDIAFFMAGLRTTRIQAYTRGLAFARSVVEGYERAFLGGYFRDDEVPDDAIALFAVQALLDKWIAREHDAQRSSADEGNAGSNRLRDAVMQRWICRQIDRLLEGMGPR